MQRYIGWNIGCTWNEPCFQRLLLANVSSLVFVLFFLSLTSLRFVSVNSFQQRCLLLVSLRVRAVSLHFQSTVHYVYCIAGWPDKHNGRQELNCSLCLSELIFGPTFHTSIVYAGPTQSMDTKQTNFRHVTSIRPEVRRILLNSPGIIFSTISFQ